MAAFARKLEKEIEEFQRERDDLRRQNAELRECLKAVEWLDGDYGTSMQNLVSCPACSIIHDKFTKDRKHQPFCKPGKALAAQPEGVP